jgi:hypothetical protein
MDGETIEEPKDGAMGGLRSRFGTANYQGGLTNGTM